MPHLSSSPPAQAPLTPPTGEMRWWARRLGPWVFADHAPARALRFALVTPLAHVANLSFDFQAHLFRIFHRSTAARVAHAALMPVIVAASLGVAFSAGGAWGVVATGALAGWYVAQSLVNGLSRLAMVAPLAAGVLGSVGHVWASANLGWFGPAPAALGLSILQALSHAAEPAAPPRTAPGARWVALADFLGAGPTSGRLAAFGRAAVSVATGAANELWASWRLLPVLMAVLGDSWFLPRARARALRRLAADALADGNPAVDLIGTGGAGPAPALFPHGDYDHERIVRPHRSARSVAHHPA